MDAVTTPLLDCSSPGCVVPFRRHLRALVLGVVVVMAFSVSILAHHRMGVSLQLQATNSSLVDKLLRLDREMDGRVIFPWANHFSEACAVWNQISVLQPPPRAVIEVASELDVRLAIQVLASLNVPFSIRSGGHSKAGYSNAPNGIILSLQRLNQIHLSLGSATEGVLAALGPAITGPEVLKVTLPNGYAAVLGFCPTVAQGGFILGGGWGLLSRKHGLGLDNLVSANVVLASSQIVTANSTHHADLLWALRGAGMGNFGVVTQMTYTLHRAQNTIIMGLLSMPAAQAAAFLNRVAGKDLPREMILILETMGETTHLFTGVEREIWERDYEKDFRRNSFRKTQNPIGFALMWACPEANCLDGGTKYFQQEIATLVSDTHLTVSDFTWLDNPWFSDIKPNTNLVQSFTGFLHPGNATLQNLQTIIDLYSRWTFEMAPYVLPDIELWGGKISEVPQGETAFPHRTAVFNLGVVVEVPKDQPATFDWIVRRLIREWHQIREFLDGAYVNYQMASLGADEYAHAYWGPHVQRLRKIKRAYDPGNLFTYPQGIPIQ